jgi:hypothetical protein
MVGAGTIRFDGVAISAHTTGGGFCLPILEGHVRFLKQSIDQLKASGKNVSVAILQYSKTMIHDAARLIWLTDMHAWSEHEVSRPDHSGYRVVALPGDQRLRAIQCRCRCVTGVDKCGSLTMI